MKTRPALWSLLLAAAVVLAGCNKHNAENDNVQPGANAPATASTATTTPGMTSTATTPPPSSTAMMPPPTAPATSSTTH